MNVTSLQFDPVTKEIYTCHIFVTFYIHILTTTSVETNKWSKKRMKLSRLIVVALIASVTFTSSAMAGETSETIVINGSTTVLPIIQKMAEVFMLENPEIAISISGGGSGNGIKALNEGLCDIAMTSRDIKESEITLAQKKGVNPQRVIVAADALVPIVHVENPISDMTKTELREIYKAKIRNWDEIGGRDLKIVVVSRDTSSGTYETWAEIIMEGERVAPSALLQASSGAVIQTVSKNKNAISYVGYGYLDDSVKKVKVDGVEATLETAMTREWPLTRDLYLFTDGEATGAVKKFIDFALDPNTGQKLVKEVGYIPLS